MITLAATGTLQGKAGTGAVITYTVSGDSVVANADAFQILGQGQLGTGAAAMVTAGASAQVLIKSIHLANTSGSAVNNVILYVNGTVAANQIVSLSIPANGEAIYAANGWTVYDANGNILTSNVIILTGDVTGSGASPVTTTLATVNANTGSFGTATNVSTVTLDGKGRATAAANTPIQITESQVTNLTTDLAGKVASVTNSDGTVTVTGTATAPIVSRAALSGDVVASAGSNAATIQSSVVTNTKMANMIAHTYKGNNTGSTAAPIDVTNTQLTADLNPATTSLQGMQSAIDKKKEDNLYYDVTANSIATLVGDDSTDNLAAWNTLYAALPVGATVFFPTGTFRFSGDMAINADKHTRIQGAGKYASIIKTTSATANGFTISGGQYWYNTFEDLRFETTGNKTAGAAILISTVGLGANKQQVGINVYRCSFYNWFKAIYALADDVTQGPGNLSVWEDLDISIPGTTGSTNSRGIHINGAGTNLICSGSTINMGFPPFQVAGTACIEINTSGAIQFVGGEFIGGTNTLLLNASSGGTTSIAAVYATNCFFDQSAGSTVKITGANVTNRCKFVQCGITGGNVAGPIAVEIASTGSGAAGTATAQADGINFIDCDIYPNSGSGTLNGFQITGAQGVSIQSSRISGWTNGISVTPSVSNGYTKFYMSDTKLGATNNFTTPNTVGLLLNAGSFQYGSVSVASNDFTGSTTPVTDNSTVASAWQKNFGGNLGLLSPGGAGTINSAAQSLTASSANLITGTSISIPTNGLRVGSRVRFNLGVIKTAAGISTWIAAVKFGTANTTADAAIASWTSGTNTGSIDQATLEIECEILTLGATATAKCIARYVNTLTNATGLGVVNAAPTSTATFNAGLTSPFMHVDITPGATAVMTGWGTVEVVA